MQHSHKFFPVRGLDKLPHCPKCGGIMWLTRVDPTDKPDHDQRTFECPSCKHADVVIVKFR